VVPLNQVLLVGQLLLVHQVDLELVGVVVVGVGVVEVVVVEVVVAEGVEPHIRLQP